MKIDNNFEADLACPVDTLFEELCRALSVRSIGVIERPESNRDPDHVEAAIFDLLQVCERHPVLPVGPQNIVERRLCAE